MSKIAGLILTYNEEANIVNCIQSLNFADKVYVFDSFSTDKTVELAKSNEAIVLQREFDNYAMQRNSALSSIPAEFDWVVMIDADERFTDELKTELLAEIARNSSYSMFRVRRKDFFMGKWLKRSSGYPTWFPRIFKRGQVVVSRDINEEYYTEGEIKHLQEHLIHFPFSKGIEWWFEKHNKYSSLEAKAFQIELQTKFSIAQLFSSDPVIRRKSQKQLAIRLPFRPQIMFLSLFLIRLGFLDGKAGYIYCRLRKVYEWMIDLKIKELKHTYENIHHNGRI